MSQSPVIVRSLCESVSVEWCEQRDWPWLCAAVLLSLLWQRISGSLVMGVAEREREVAPAPLVLPGPKPVVFRDVRGDIGHFCLAVNQSVLLRSRGQRPE